MERIFYYPLAVIFSLWMPTLALGEQSFLGNFAAYVATKSAEDQDLYERYSSAALTCTSETLGILVAGTRAKTIREMLSKAKKTPAQVVASIDHVCDAIHGKDKRKDIWHDIRNRLVMPLSYGMIEQNMDVPLPAIRLPSGWGSASSSRPLPKFSPPPTRYH